MRKKLLTTFILSTLSLKALDMPPMPPMVPMDKNTNIKKQKDTKNTQPKSCEMIPPMVIFLPPPMEKQVVKCKNEMFKPKKELVQKQLSKLLKKKIKVKKIEIVEKFNQLYKVTYDGGEILTNKDVNAFIKQ